MHVGAIGEGGIVGPETAMTFDPDGEVHRVTSPRSVVARSDVS
jgi:hypothetical protein